MNKTSVAVLLFSLIALINAQCSCQSKPPVDIKYPGEACECSRQYPIQMEIPKITEHRDAHYDYGFTIERPQEAPAEVKYTFDFHMEKPKPLPTASLGNYAFEVQSPVQTEEQPRYIFDYKIQTPVAAKKGQFNLEGLLAQVDKVVVQKQDCQDKNSCQCSGYKPTIDLLQRCPKHGHLYQSGGPLHPNQQRYNNEIRSFEQPIPYAALPSSSDRPKRNVAGPLPIKMTGLLSGLRSNNQILKAAPQPVENKNQIRIEQIMRQNFGEDPTENIEELLKPKPLVSNRKKNDEVKNAKVVVDAPPSTVTPAFLSKIKPKLDEARANFRSRISKIVNRARLDAIKANHVMDKRSTETDSSAEYLGDTYEESSEPIWIADMSVEDQETENGIDHSKSVNDDGEPTSNGDRFRKHCDRCEELAKKFPCPSYGGIPFESTPQNVQISPEDPIHYVPEYQAQPRYVSAATDDVGSYHGQPAYGELQDILSKNSAAMHQQNRRIGNGHLVQPMNFEHASEAIRFIQELTLRNNQQHEDYHSNRNSHAVSAQNFHSKRSFKIEPLAEKDDGTVYVKISPVRSQKWDVESKMNKKIERQNPSAHHKQLKDGQTKANTQLASKVNANNKFGNANEKTNFEKVGQTKANTQLASKVNANNKFGNANEKTNFEKVVRNGKNYEILTVNGSDDESTGSVEDLQILKYIYELNENGYAKDNASSGEIIGDNELRNTNAQVDT